MVFCDGGRTVVLKAQDVIQRLARAGDGLKDHLFRATIQEARREGVDGDHRKAQQEQFPRAAAAVVGDAVARSCPQKQAGVARADDAQAALADVERVDVEAGMGASRRVV